MFQIISHKTFSFFVLFIFLFSCQSIPKEPVLEFSDLTNRFQSFDKEAQKEALENNWSFFKKTFNYEDFEKTWIQEFPSLQSFDSQTVLSGKTFLDFSLNSKKSLNPVLLLLAIDLEMELLARFHSSGGANSPRCLETFWSEWKLPIPLVNRGPLIILSDETPKKASSNTNKEPNTEADINTSKKLSKKLSEEEMKLADYLKTSLALDKKTELTPLSIEGIKHALFKLPSGDIYEIFQSPITCKEIASKEAIIPLLGKITCLQKTSGAWVSFPSEESSLLENQWSLESQKTCLKWIKPLTENLRKTMNKEIEKSGISRSWSLYPRLRSRMLREADRFESAFRKSLN